MVYLSCINVGILRFFSICICRKIIWLTIRKNSSVNDTKLLDMLEVFVNPSCAVMNHGSSGLELIAMGYNKLHLYNFKSKKWRNGPPSIRVSWEQFARRV